MKKIKKFDENFEGGGSKKSIYPPLVPLMGLRHPDFARW